MSKIKAIITQINSVENLNIVKFDFNGSTLKMMSLDLAQNVKIGKKVILVVKPTHIALAKDFLGELSYSNQIKAKVVECENGKLLSAVKLSVNNAVFESIITVDSAIRMGIKKDDNLTMLIKASDLSIFEVLDD